MTTIIIMQCHQLSFASFGAGWHCPSLWFLSAFNKSAANYHYVYRALANLMSEENSYRLITINLRMRILSDGSKSLSATSYHSYII